MRVNYFCDKIKDIVDVECEERQRPGLKREPGKIFAGKQLYCHNESECLEGGVEDCLFANKEGRNPLETLSR